MRRLTLHFIIALLAFIIGVASVSLWFILRRPSPGAANIPVQLPAEPKRTYERGAAGESNRGSFITLISSDGMRFMKLSVYCYTSKRAGRELQKRLRKATEIVSRETVFNEGGQEIGEKIVALFSPNDPENSPVTLIWTENEKLYQVEGASLHNILEYRKDFRR